MRRASESITTVPNVPVELVVIRAFSARSDQCVRPESQEQLAHVGHALRPAVQFEQSLILTTVESLVGSDRAISESATICVTSNRSRN